MRTGELITWLLLAPIFSFISWKYGAVQILNIYPNLQLSVTDFLITSWTFMSFKFIIGQTSITQILREAIQCFSSKYWCDEKGWWIQCTRNCQDCRIQTKKRISLWEARLLCLTHGLSLIIIFFLVLYIILYPEAAWGLI